MTTVKKKSIAKTLHGHCPYSEKTISLIEESLESKPGINELKKLIKIAKRYHSKCTIHGPMMTASVLILVSKSEHYNSRFVRQYQYWALEALRREFLYSKNIRKSMSRSFEKGAFRKALGKRLNAALRPHKEFATLNESLEDREILVFMLLPYVKYTDARQALRKFYNRCHKKSYRCSIPKERGLSSETRKAMREALVGYGHLLAPVKDFNGRTEFHY